MDAMERLLRSIRQRTLPQSVLPALGETARPPGGEAPAPQVFVAKIAELAAGVAIHSYWITQQRAISGAAPDLYATENCTAADGFVHAPAQEVFGNGEAHVGDTVLAWWVRRTVGGRALFCWVMKAQPGGQEIMEISHSVTRRCSSILVDSTGRIIGGYDSNGQWFGVGTNREPAEVPYWHHW